MMKGGLVDRRGSHVYLKQERRLAVEFIIVCINLLCLS